MAYVSADNLADILAGIRNNMQASTYTFDKDPENDKLYTYDYVTSTPGVYVKQKSYLTEVIETQNDTTVKGFPFKYSIVIAQDLSEGVPFIYFNADTVSTNDKISNKCDTGTVVQTDSSAPDYGETLPCINIYTCVSLDSGSGLPELGTLIDKIVILK